MQRHDGIAAKVHAQCGWPGAAAQGEARRHATAFRTPRPCFGSFAGILPLNFSPPLSLHSLHALQKLDTAVEVLGTLRELLANAEPTKFLLYPQIILIAMSLLNSSVVRIGELAMAILLQVRASLGAQ